MSTSKGIKNITFGLLSQILTLAIGIIIPRLVLVNLGSEANGLLSSVGNILSYMSLLEAGVGTATLQALYKPCATGDHDSTNSIIAATDYFYRRTGKVYLLIVILLSIIYTLFVHSELPRIDVFIVVLLSGLSGVLSYFFQGKLKIFLSAEGKTYVNTNIVTVVHIGTSIAKAILLYVGYGVVAVQASAFCFALIQMAVYIIYIRHQYPWLNVNTKPDFDAISQRNSVLIHQISGLIFSNTDVLLLTIFTSFKEVSVYSMYAMIYGMVEGLAIILYNSYTYALGQTYNTDRTRFFRMFDAFEVMTMMVTFSLYCICRVMINPFLELYTAGVNDIRYADRYLPWLFAVFYLLHSGRTSSGTAIQIAQHFSQTKWRSILESVINVTVSLICVYKFGIYGVLMGTIAALFYRTNDMIIYAAKILGRSCWITYRRWLLNIGIFGILSLAFSKFEINANNYLELVVDAIIVSVVTVTVFTMINAVFERNTASYILNILKNTLKPVFRRKKEEF